MNPELQEYGRRALKESLAKLTKDQQYMFKRMYAHNNLDCTIEEAVDNMEKEKIDWAMTQVQSSLNSNLNKAAKNN